MAAVVRAVQHTVENANMIAGVEVDTAVYIGTGATCPILQVGRNPSVYVLEGTQTAQTYRVVVGLTNASRGDRFTVRLGTGLAGVGTSICQVVNGSFAGSTVAIITSGVGREATVVFDGVAWK